MKTKNITRKLKLDKMVIANLNEIFAGGVEQEPTVDCHTVAQVTCGDRTNVFQAWCIPPCW